MTAPIQNGASDMLIAFALAGVMLALAIAIVLSMHRSKKSDRRIDGSRRAMTKEEFDRQRISFVYGNTKISNGAVTREMVEDIAKKIDKENEDEVS